MKTAELYELVKVDYKVRSLKDSRKKVDRYLFSYRCGANEYRRSIEVKPGSPRPEPLYTITIKA